MYSSVRSTSANRRESPSSTARKLCSTLPRAMSAIRPSSRQTPLIAMAELPIWYSGDASTGLM